MLGVRQAATRASGLSRQLSRSRCSAAIVVDGAALAPVGGALFSDAGVPAVPAEISLICGRDASPRVAAVDDSPSRTMQVRMRMRGGDMAGSPHHWP